MRQKLAVFERNNNLVALISGLAAMLAIILLAGWPAAAAQTPSGNGLRISPVRESLTINQGKSKTIQLDVENVTSSTTTLETIVNDFTASGENGTPDIIVSRNASAATHSLKQFVQPVPNFELKPGQQKEVNVTIKVPEGTAGGGYYGVVRFLPVGSNDASKSVSVAASPGTLVLLKVPGDINESVRVASFDVRKNDDAGHFFTSSNGLSAVVRFENTGNIQEAPFGKILLKKGGKTLAQYEINNSTPPGNVLPQTIRRFSVPLDKVGSWGKYEVEGNFGYGTSGKLISVSYTFYVIPLALIIAAIVIIILIILAIYFGRKELRRHDRKLLARAKKRR